MADRHIDQDETKIYGSYAAQRIRTRVVGLMPAFDDALGYCADQLDLVTSAMTATVETARSRDEDKRKGTKGKRVVLKQAVSLLGKLSVHLGTHEPDVIDRRVYFTKDGTASGVGKGAQNVTLAVVHIAGKLADPRSPVREREYWAKRFQDMAAALAPAVAFADDAIVDRRLATPEVEAARQVWLNTYQAAKSLVECVLRLAGRLDQMPLFFYDLRVPANTKVIAAPTDDSEQDALADAAAAAGDDDDDAAADDDADE